MGFPPFRPRKIAPSGPSMGYARKSKTRHNYLCRRCKEHVKVYISHPAIIEESREEFCEYCRMITDHDYMEVGMTTFDRTVREFDN